MATDYHQAEQYPDAPVVDTTPTLTYDPELAGGYFVQVPSEFLRTPLYSVFAKLLYSILLSYAGAGVNAFPGQERLCQEMGISKPTLLKAMDELISGNLIVSKRRGLGKTNLYHLHKFVLKSRSSPPLLQEVKNLPEVSGANIQKSATFTSESKPDLQELYSEELHSKKDRQTTGEPVSPSSSYKTNSFSLPPTPGSTTTPTPVKSSTPALSPATVSSTNNLANANNNNYPQSEAMEYYRSKGGYSCGQQQQAQASVISQLAGEYGLEWVKKAISIAEGAGKVRNLKYIGAILSNCKVEGHAPGEEAACYRRQQAGTATTDQSVGGGGIGRTVTGEELARYAERERQRTGVDLSQFVQTTPWVPPPPRVERAIKTGIGR
jgi:hypothetical protein